MTTKRILLFLALCGLAAAALCAAAVPIPPAPTRWVTDTAGFLKESTVAALDGQLEGYERATGHQVLVWIGPTTGDTPTEEWTVNAFAKWKVGRKGLDDGLVLFLFPQDHKVRVEVGYGLEDKVPDVVAFRIIADVMIPKIRAGDNDGAVTAGVDALLGAIGGAQGSAEAGTAPNPPGASGGRAERGYPVQQISLGQVILFAILGIAFLILLVTHPGLAIYLLFSILSGGRGGGGFGGGGGFSGGGGSGGGGGATGSW